MTEAALLTAMETAGRTLDDKALSETMRSRGLGTSATRASIIETLLQRQYVDRRGKILVPTDKGINMIKIVHADVKSPAMTGQWYPPTNAPTVKRHIVKNSLAESSVGRFQ